ncbi:MAG: YceI family protein [Herpetosiphon sp.]
MQWTIDASHSAIDFSVRHMMISTVRGSFAKFSGTVNIDEADPTRSAVEVQIDASSIDTRDAQRDGHLRGPDFFDAEKFPTLTFKSKRVERHGESQARIIGDLTIRDVTREVTLDTEYNGQAKSPWGTVSAGFEAHTKISRKDWGLTWNAALETGGMLVGDEIKISIQIEVVKSPEEAEKLVAEQAAAS